MNFQQLEYLLAINRCGSMTRAADECHITQQAVSNAVKSLERELGINLLTRTSSGVELSPECQRLLDPARKVIEGFKEIKAIASLEAQTEGTVRLAIAKRILRSNGPHPTKTDLERFEAAHPAIHVKKFTSASDACYSMLEHKMADMAIAVGVKNPAEFNSVLLSTREAVVVTSAQAANALDGDVSFKDLSSFIFVPPPDLGNSLKQIVDICRHYGFEPEFYTDNLLEDNLIKTVMTHDLAFVIPIDVADGYCREAKSYGFEPVVLRISADERFYLERRLVWRADEELSDAAKLLRTYLSGLAEV